VANGVVYFGAGDHYVYALDAMSGEKLWDFEAESTVISSPAVANGIVYIGSGGKYSYALDAQNGRLRLRFKTIYAVTASAAVKDGIVYFSTVNGNLYAVDGDARTWFKEHEIRPYWAQLWAMGFLPAPPAQSGILWALQLEDKTGRSSPVVTGDTLYIGSENKLVAIDLQSREEPCWEFETGGLVNSSPAVAGNAIYFGSEDGKLYALDTTTGEELWEIPTGDRITSSPAVAGGTLYVGSHDGNLYAVK
jgi:outer membrane protein assembly factor BamB